MIQYDIRKIKGYSRFSFTLETGTVFHFVGGYAVQYKSQEKPWTHIIEHGFEIVSPDGSKEFVTSVEHLRKVVDGPSETV